MGVFEQYPYTNFHDLNLDWIVKEVKTVKDKTDEIDNAVDAATEKAEIATAQAAIATDKAKEVSEIYNNIEGKFDTIDNQITANTNDIELNTARIDSLATLTEGSTTGDAELADIRVEYDGVIASSAGNAVREQVKDLHYIKSDKTVTSFNKFDNTRVVTGYVSYTTGEIVNNAGFYTSDFIPVEAGLQYKILNSGNQQVAVYDSNKKYLTGYANANTFNLTVLPANSAFVRFCFATSYLMSAQFYRNNEYVPLKFWDSQTAFKQENIADGVKGEIKTYTKTVTSVAELIDAVNNLLLTDGYHYVIYLSEGTYNLDSSIISQLTNSTYGITLPDNVDLIGLGAGAVINLDLTGASSTQQSLVSTLNVRANNKLENLTVTALNCRYAVHADNSNSIKNYTQTAVNSKFIHYGNPENGWAYPAAWGIGTASGAKTLFENCEFISPLRAITLHNNNNFDNPSITKFNNCGFICTDKKCAVNIGSLNSGVTDIVEFTGCYFNQLIDCRINDGSVSANSFKIIAKACDNICANFYFTDGKIYTLDIKDQMFKIMNTSGAVINRFTPVKYFNGDIVPLAANDNKTVCVGVAIENIAADEAGLIQNKGLIDVSTIPGVYQLGQKIGIVNGSLAVVTTDDYIGVVTYINTNYNRKYMLIK